MTYSSYFEHNREKLKKEFSEFIQFKTVSADPNSLSECKQCAQWLEQKLKKMGFSTSIWGEGFPPVVFGSYQSTSDTPTLLIYNHYDVQPVDPIEQWQSDPFTARFEGDTIIARGAQDNKGQAFYVLSALEALYDKHNGFPCSIKILIEGEEESGSTHLKEVLERHKNEIQADYAMIVDLGMRSLEKPAITLGTRGLIALTIELNGTTSDLHSGVQGGLAYNPLHALVEMLASCRTSYGSIAIPGFYDGIETPTHDLLDKVSWDFNIPEYIDTYGQPPTGGEKGYRPLERNWLRPTLEINGITGGYGGPGSKTVIPSKAIAKLTCRLVPGQNPKVVAERVKAYFESVTPKGVSSKVIIHSGTGEAVRTSVSSPCIKALSEAMKEVFKTDAEFILEGASIPIVPELKKATGADVVMWGLGLATDRIHAPNEHFDFNRIRQGFLITCQTIELLGGTA